jgi:hypothetical protein
MGGPDAGLRRGCGSVRELTGGLEQEKVRPFSVTFRMATSRQHALDSVCSCGRVFGLSLLMAAAGRADDLNRFGLNTHIGFNIKADFKGLGGFPAQTNPGPESGGADHVYDNGFNRVDASGNAGGRTWNWGYQAASQVQSGAIAMSSSSAAGTGQIGDVKDDLQWGAELTYARQLGSNNSYWWGLVAGLSWLNLDLKQDASLSSDVQRLTDTYALDGVIAPLAPYAGTFEGPGPLLGDQPSRRVETIPGGARTAGQYQIEGNLYALRLGLLYESPFNDWVALQLGGGGVGGVIDSEFRVAEQVMLTGVGELARYGSSSKTALVGGAYGEIGLIFHLAEHWSASASVQYQYLSDFSQTTDGKEAHLNLKDTLFLSVGVGARF